MALSGTKTRTILLGRWSQLAKPPGQVEISKLEAGMDFREPRYRREVFHRFYEFHLRYKSHPGCVYFLLPFLRDNYGWDKETELWAAFINGNTQNPVTTWLILQQFPELQTTDPFKVSKYINDNWAKLEWDSDRKHQKKTFGTAVERYQSRIFRTPQQEYFSVFCSSDGEWPEVDNFNRMWDLVTTEFYGMGRLSTWSYLEYLKIAGLPLDTNDLMLEDLDGSKSHRNGMCKVLGRDDLDWHKSNPRFSGHTPEVISWLCEEADLLLQEAKDRAVGEEWENDVNFLTLESALCTYKSWHRPNRRYPNVYSDMFFERIKKAEANWPSIDFSIFWEARKKALPKKLRLEDNPRDFGVHQIKQNLYKDTGAIPMMSIDDPVFACEYDQFLED